MPGCWRSGARRRRCGDDWNRLDGPRRATPWRVWKLLRQELATAISGVRHWNLDRWPACLAVMQERPGRRPLQTLPDRVNHLIAQCQALGMSSRAIALKFSCLAPQEVGEIVGTPTGFKSFVFDP